MTDVLLGTQGWRHTAWLGSFYPAAMPPDEMLARYAAAFPTVEVTDSALALPRELVLREWGAAVPSDFRFAFTAPLPLTHEHRLAGGAELLHEFSARLACLGERLGPIRIPLSAAFRPDPDARRRLAAFLAALPEDRRWALEFRDRRWLDGATLGLLRSHGVAAVLSDSRWLPRARVLDLVEQPTADFAYFRWSGRGPSRRAAAATDGDLRPWERAVRRLAGRVDLVFGYFGEQFGGHAPSSARALIRSLLPEPVAASVSPAGPPVPASHGMTA